ncbi:nucleotidyltransferase [uncultured Robinsoniella sp.]|uniref:nucleotidyltransferase n=1 Tax=uncultured Robinsoniella sp. TaxID=904190 RepID=UPI00374F5202
MKVVGLVTEYNPFHNGHRYHLEQAKEKTGADFVVVVMSGNFLQRGEAAIIDKFSRAEMALSCGADLVLEIPAYFACASAEYFALGAVSLLDSLGIIDSICFGSEWGDIQVLDEIAEILAEEPLPYKNALKDLLAEGRSFPAAREEALLSCLSVLHASGKEDWVSVWKNVLDSPNNILGIEYLKALKKLKSNMVPVTIERILSGYHDPTLYAGISSATAIRRVIQEEQGKLLENESGKLSGNLLVNPIKEQIPNEVCAILKRESCRTFPVKSADFSLPLHYRLISATAWEELAEFFDVSPDLAKRIWNLRYSYQGFEDFTACLKTRQFTETRIRRALMHILLGITEDEVKKAVRDGNGACYIRVLGFNKDASVLLTEIKKKSPLPIITKMADAYKLLENSPASQTARKMLDCDIYSAQVYHSAVSNLYKGHTYNEIIRQIIVQRQPSRPGDSPGDA